MNGFGKCSVAAVAAAVLVGPATAARNLITNFDHRERMGIDIATGWTKHFRDKMVTSIDVEPQADGSVKFTVQGEPYSFYEQRNLKLVPGGRYRLSYDVKTSGNHGSPFKIFLRDAKWDWNTAQEGPLLPDDT